MMNIITAKGGHNLKNRLIPYLSRSGSFSQLSVTRYPASINRIAAWVSGARSFRKALLYAFLFPHEKAAELQENAEFTDLFVLTEEFKTAPFAAVWEEYCRRSGVEPGIEWLDSVKQYEKKVTSKR